MHQQFKAISVSHKTAPIEVRETIALSEEGCKQLMTTNREVLLINELLILSTCNRTEIYYTSADDLSSEIIKLLGIQKGIGDIGRYHSYFRSITSHNEAVNYLFEVSIGLQAQVVGDMQITNQVKNAYQWSADLGMAGPFLHRLMHAIFFTNKKVVQETSFRDGAASVSYAAVELLEELTEEITQPNVLVVGLGEIGADVCKNLAKNKRINITLTNRTYAKAVQLAEEFELKLIPFENIWHEMGTYDVIVCSIGKDEPFITKAYVEQMNILSFKYFIDLSVPRSVESTIEEIPGALVYNIDDIQNRASEALQKRIASIPKVKHIIDEAIVEFQDWTKEMAVSPTINKLKNALEQIRQEEMGRYLKGMSSEESDRVDRITKGIMQKIIKLPVLQLKAACKRGEAETLIDVLNDLFDLEKQSDKV